MQASFKERQIGDYLAVSEIGSGGMAMVYRARHVNLGREVALKVLAGGNCYSSDALARFTREAKLIAKLKHPNIVPLHEFGRTEDGSYYYTMDLVHGKDYATIIREEHPRPRTVARTVAILAAAIHHAHEQGIIHRDLKPHNVMIDDVGTPLILDFGLAKNVRDEASVEISRSGLVIGTLCYMPREQVQGNLKLVDERSDVYSLGAILYEGMTGRPPFVGDSQFDLMHKIINEDPLPPRDLNPAVPIDLQTICLKCLRKMRQQRYQTAQDLHLDLVRFLENRPIRAKPPSVITLGMKFFQRHRSFTVGAVIVLLTLLLALAFAVDQWRGARNALDDAVEARREAQETRLRAETARAEAEIESHRAKRQEAKARAAEEKATRTLLEREAVLAQLGETRDFVDSYVEHNRLAGRPEQRVALWTTFLALHPDSPYRDRALELRGKAAADAEARANRVAVHEPAVLEWIRCRRDDESLGVSLEVAGAPAASNRHVKIVEVIFLRREDDGPFVALGPSSPGGIPVYSLLDTGVRPGAVYTYKLRTLAAGDDGVDLPPADAQRDSAELGPTPPVPHDLSFKVFGFNNEDPTRPEVFGHLEYWDYSTEQKISFIFGSTFHEGDVFAGRYRIHRVVPERREVVIRMGRKSFTFAALDPARTVDSWPGPLRAVDPAPETVDGSGG